MAAYPGVLPPAHPTRAEDRQALYAADTTVYAIPYYGAFRSTPIPPDKQASGYISAFTNPQTSVYPAIPSIVDSGANGGQAGGGYIRTLGQLWPPAVAEVIQLSDPS